VNAVPESTDPLTVKLDRAERQAREQTRDPGPTQVNGADGAPPWFEQNTPPAEGTTADTHANMPVLVDLLALAKTEPQPPQFIIPRWLQEGTVALLAGHGGKGKSLILLFVCVCIALGRALWGMTVQRRRVAVFSFEDGEETMHWRLSRICALLGVTLADLHHWLFVFDGSDADAVLFADTPRDGPHITATYEWLRDTIRAHRIEVAGIDGASDTFMANENNRALVKRFIVLLRRLIPRHGAVILLAHVNRPTATSGKTTEGYSGSTAWHNAVRCRWYLRSEATDDDDPDGADSAVRVLELQKANNAREGDKIELRWNDSAHCFVADTTPQPGKLQRGLREVELRDWLLDRIRYAEAKGDPVPSAVSGPRNARLVLAAVDGFPSSDFGGRQGRKRFWAMLERLRSDGRIFEDSVRTASKNKAGVLRARTNEKST
jgi:RecA-family ATPase